MLAITIWWAVSARKWFKGPKINMEHQMLGREENVLDAKEAGQDSGDSSSESISRGEDRIADDKKAANLA